MSTRFPLYILAHNIRSLYNVGSFFRTTDALGAKKLYLTGYTGHPRTKNDPREKRVIERCEKQIAKTALSGFEAVGWEYAEDAREVLHQLRSDGVQLVAVETQNLASPQNSTSLFEASWKPPVCLIFGHEVEGLPQEIIDLADLVVEIPMFGVGKSLNVAVAVGVVGYSVLRVLQGRQFPPPAF